MSKTNDGKYLTLLFPTAKNAKVGDDVFTTTVPVWVCLPVTKKSHEPLEDFK